MSSPTSTGTSVTGLLIFLVMLVVPGSSLSAAEDRKAIPNYGQLQTATWGVLREGFAQPDMIYAPFLYWFWDEPIDREKIRGMTRQILAQHFNPGYLSSHQSMADILGPKVMEPHPSMPKDQWLSELWFDAVEDVVSFTEKNGGYVTYTDEYMWPSGRAAGRVMQKHPELANESLQWEVTDVSPGTKADLPESFFTVAAKLDQRPDPARFRVPVCSNVFELVWSPVGDPPREDLSGKVSLGQTVTIERDRLAEVLVSPAGWKETSDARFTIEARLDGPAGRVIASRHFDGGIRTSAFFYFWISLPIPEALPVGSKLYVAMIPDPGLPEKELGWWSNTNDVYAGGKAYLNGQPVGGCRHVKLNYLVKPELTGGRGPHQMATICSATLQMIGSGDKFSWTAPTNGCWRIYSFNKIMGGDVNVLDTRLSGAFIEIAHKPYVEHFGKRLGKSIPGSICDTEGNYGIGGGLPWSESLAPRYLANTGREIRLWMPLMLDEDVEGVSARARFDWFDAVSDLYAGYFAGVNDWLTKQGVYYVGNLWEESLTWQASLVGDFMKAQRAFSLPGMDALGLRIYEVHDFKETQSVAEFEGRRYECEFMGAGGWSVLTTINLKQGINAVTTWGASHIVPHALFMTRKQQGNVWAPDYYDENPMWSYMHLWSDFTRRAMYVNSQGHVVPDVLLLNPQESVWALLGDNTEKIWNSPEAGNVNLIHSLYDSKVRNIDAVYSEAMVQLSGHRIEYLIADRHYLNQMSVHGKRLVRGGFQFKTVVLPPVVVLPLAVARKIVEFAKAGGNVYTLGELPTGSTDNGLHDPAMAALMSQLQAQPGVKACAQGLARELDAKSPGLNSPIQFISGEFPMLQLRRRIDNRNFFWLVNNNEQARQCVVQVAGVKGGASVWDCETGNIRPVASTKEMGGAKLQLAFQPHEAYWLVFDPKQPVRSKPVMALPNEKVVLPIEGTWTVRMDPTVQPNLEHAVNIPDAWTAPAGVAHDLTLWDTWAEVPGNFSGLLDYTKTVTLPAFEGQLVLDLGKVHHFAEAWVNGKHVGAKLWPSHKFQTDAFRPGNNEIRIRVGNLVNNNYNMASASGLVGPVSLKTPVP